MGADDADEPGAGDGAEHHPDPDEPRFHDLAFPPHGLRGREMGRARTSIGPAPVLTLARVFVVASRSRGICPLYLLSYHPVPRQWTSAHWRVSIHMSRA